MQRRAARPTAHSQIRDFFATQIEDGDLEFGQQLPTEAEIARQFGVSRATVQSAMSRLVLEGWIERYPGRGTFARRPDEIRGINIDVHNILSFEDDVAIRDDRVTYQLLSFGRVRASKIVASRLTIDIGTSVFSLVRLRFVDDNCIGFEKRYFSPKLSLDIGTAALDSAPTHEIIQSYLHLSIGRIDAALRAVLADEEDAAHLGVDVGAPLLVRSHTIISTDGEVILYGDSAYVEPFAFFYTASSSA